MFSPDVILCGWLGSKHQLTNWLTRLVNFMYSSNPQSRTKHLSRQEAPSTLIVLVYYYSTFKLTPTSIPSSPSPGHAIPDQWSTRGRRRITSYFHPLPRMVKKLMLNMWAHAAVNWSLQSDNPLCVHIGLKETFFLFNCLILIAVVPHSLLFMDLYS